MTATVTERAKALMKAAAVKSFKAIYAGKSFSCWCAPFFLTLTRTPLWSTYVQVLTAGHWSHRRWPRCPIFCGLTSTPTSRTTGTAE
jgi:hypothetical protein